MKRRMFWLQKRWASSLSLIAISALLTACGEYWDGGDPVASRKMTLGRDTIDLMVGDQYSIPVYFEPDNLSNRSVWWQIDDSEIANVEDNVITAVSEGSTTVWAMSVSDRQTASCNIKVWPRWYVNTRSYPYDTVIYANITIDGEPVGDDIFIGAFCKGELRGVAEKREIQGHTCTIIRVWSSQRYGEVIYFRHYDPHHARLVRHDFWLPFTGNSFGSPSEPYEIELN